MLTNISERSTDRVAPPSQRLKSTFENELGCVNIRKTILLAGSSRFNCDVVSFSQSGDPARSFAHLLIDRTFAIPVHLPQVLHATLSKAGTVRIPYVAGCCGADATQTAISGCLASQSTTTEARSFSCQPCLAASLQAQQQRQQRQHVRARSLRLCSESLCYPHVSPRRHTKNVTSLPLFASNCRQQNPTSFPNLLRASHTCVRKDYIIKQRKKKR